MIDFTNVIDIMLGQNQVTQIEDSLGNVLWSATPAVEYFYVEDISGAANTLSIVKFSADAPTIEVFKSTDMSTWESMGNTDTTAITATVPANGKLYLKAVTDRWTGTTFAARNQISCSGNHNVGGHIMSLLYGDNFENATFTNSNKWAFQRLFIGNTTLINAKDLILPSNTIDYCYSRLFESCGNLVTVPVLPAMVMTLNCYQGMFQYVHTSFTSPALPATTLANGCYDKMFWDSYITTAPALPATTLAESCYASMFRYCSRLTTAPVLPATTLAQYCYNQMFANTNLATAPVLPATTLARSCYQSMFQSTRLTATPVLPATTLVIECYRDMFNGCSQLNTVTSYANDISAGSCLTTWLSGVAATGDFYNLGTATYPSGTSGIPSGWTEHTSL